MSDDAYGATIAKYRLSRLLRKLRVARGYTAHQVCDILGWSHGKVDLLEVNEWQHPEFHDIRALLALYEARESEAEEIEDLAMRTHGRPWWRDYPGLAGNEFSGFQNDASTIRTLTPITLPSLLQTEAYTESLLRTNPKSLEQHAEVVEARRRQQEILDRTNGTAPTLSAVITEASLLYRWGTWDDRREQILHLIDLAGRRNVELRIQRFEDGPPRGICLPVTIFSFDDGDPSLAFIETDPAWQTITEARSVADCVRQFHEACDSALDPHDTVLQLEKLSYDLIQT